MVCHACRLAQLPPELSKLLNKIKRVAGTYEESFELGQTLASGNLKQTNKAKQEVLFRRNCQGRFALPPIIDFLQYARPSNLCYISRSYLICQQQVRALQYVLTFVLLFFA